MRTTKRGKQVGGGIVPEENIGKHITYYDYVRKQDIVVQIIKRVEGVGWLCNEYHETALRDNKPIAVYIAENSDIWKKATLVN